MSRPPGRLPTDSRTPYDPDGDYSDDEDEEEDSEGEGEEDDDRVDIIDAKVRSLLEKAIRKHHLSEKRVEYFVQRFEQLHMTYKEVEQRESALLIKNQKLYKDRRQIEERHDQEGSKQVVRGRRIEVLGEQKRSGMEQLRLSEKQISENEMGIIQKEVLIREMERQVEESKQERERREKPIVDAYKTQIAELRKDLHGRMLSFDRFKKQRDNLTTRMKETDHAIQDLRKGVAHQKRQFERVRMKPARERQQAALVFEALANSQRELAETEESIAEASRSLGNAQELREKAHREIETYREALVTETSGTETLTNEIDSLRIKVRRVKQLRRRLTIRSTKLQADISTTELHLKNLTDDYRSQKRTQDAKTKKIRLVEKQIWLLQRNVESLHSKNEDLQKEKERLYEIIESHKQEILSLSQGVDLQVAEYMGMEERGIELVEQLAAKKSRVNMFEGDVGKLMIEQREAQRRVTQLTSEREHVAREAANAKKTFVETVGKMKIVAFVNADLRKMKKELASELRTVKIRYSTLKTERNRYARAIQESAQTVSQITENKKILDNEHDVLSRKSMDKEIALRKVQGANDKILDLQEKDKTKLSHLMQRLDALTKQQGEVDSQTMKLNTLLSEKEREMTTLKQIYMQNVDDRNATGVQLVDRNDELCILYEKASMQERILKECELRLQDTAETERRRRIEVDNLQRELKVVFSKIPAAHTAIRERDSLHDQLLEAQEMTRELSSRIENPAFNARWRYLEGEIPTEEDLREQVLDLEERLNRKNEKIMEKMLILQEITKTSDGLRNVALRRRDHSLDLALTINAIQSNIRKEVETIRALWAELAVYQSRRIHIDAHNKQLELFASSVRKKMFGEVEDEDDEDGPQHPATITEPIEEWDLEYERRREASARRRDQDLARRARKMEMERERQHASDGTMIRDPRSTATQRPNSYIPEASGDLGVPKPYLMKPVLPSGVSYQLKRIARGRRQKKQPIIL